MDSEKNWNRAWSAEEMIENADKWSLAGDIALLNTMKQFANNLLTKTDQLSSNINDLLNDLNEVGLQLDLSQNEFQSLKNTQFIESRVYDDDETLDSKGNETVVDKNDNQLEEETQVDINLTLEVKLLDKYFETVEISISDSEDESEKSFVLKPVDLYIDRPLPPIIGSEEWYTNWYLEDEISDIDSEKSEETCSDSDNDNNLPKDLMFLSETSSEDFSHTATENKPVANSTLKNATKRPESIISSEESEGSNYLPTKPPISNKTFVEQLTAKLDRVISEDGNISEQINSKPLLPNEKNSFLGLFADEPPPLSDSEDITTKGIFSGGSNLFDEDNNMLFDSNKKNSYHPQNMQKDKNIDTGSDNDFLPQSSQISKGLFDSDNSDEEIVFKNHKQNTFLQSHKMIVPLIDDEPPTIDVSDNLEPSSKKIPIGGVSVFGKQNIDDLMKKTQKYSIESPVKSPLEYDKPKDVSKKTLNLFDDNDKDIFEEVVTKPLTKKFNLFNELNEENEQKSNSKISQKKKNISSLFDDDEASEQEDDLFKNQEKRFNLFYEGPSEDPTVNKNEEKLDVDQFGSIEDVGSTPTGTTFDILNEAKSSNNLSKVHSLEKDNQLKSTSLFDDNEEDDEDDIFANVTKKIDFKLFDEPGSSDYLFSIKKQVSTDSALKTANIERTEDYMKNTNNENHVKTTKEADNVIDSQDMKKDEFCNKISSDNKISKNLEESCTIIKKEGDGLFDGNKKLNNNNNDLFKDVTIETSMKPHMDEKSPLSTSPEDTTKNEYIFETKIPPADTVPFSFMSTSPIANDTSYDFKAKIPPVADLFSSTPPPDDYTWDNKSDTLSDTEDFLGYQIDQNKRARSSLFDNEPPSLIEDESSGDCRNNPSQVFSIPVDSKTMTIDNITPSDTVENSSIDEQNKGKNEIKIVNKDEPEEKDSKRIASITEMLKNQNQKEMTENRVSPGKLKQNLNINVNALLPGFSQPKIKSIIKTQSLDSTEDNLKNETWNNSSLNESKGGTTEVVSEKPLGYDETDQVEVLPSITKERVRIPAKRRPSSRRGRQEAIRKSALEEFSPDDILKASGDLESPTQKVSDLTETKLSAEKKYVIENNENIKTASEAISIESPWLGGERTVESINKRDIKNNLFDSGSESDNDLFGSKKNERNMEKKYNPTSSNNSKMVTKKSLFNDSSSDEDLFLGRSSHKKTSAAKISEIKVRTTIKKLENVESIEDPLSNLLK